MIYANCVDIKVSHLFLERKPLRLSGDTNFAVIFQQFVYKSSLKPLSMYSNRYSLTLLNW